MIRRIVSALTRAAGTPGWLAVELGSRTVRLAHVRPNGTRPVVEFAEERPWSADEPKSLQRVAREFNARRFRCIALLRPEQYQILLVEAPAVKRGELKAAVRWRIKDMLDYPVDEATIDVLEVQVPATTESRAHFAYTVAARNDVIRRTVERFEQAGMPLAVIDIPDTAQRNVAALFESDKRGVVALSFDGYGGLITVNFASELYLSRRLELTDEQLCTSVGEERERLFGRVLVELQRSVDHCERTYPFFSLGRLVLGALPDDIGLREHLAANLYLPVEPLDLAQVARLPARPQWSLAQQAKWLKLVGAGLRVERKAA